MRLQNSISLASKTARYTLERGGLGEAQGR